jgi:hypothetical protein
MPFQGGLGLRPLSVALPPSPRREGGVRDGHGVASFLLFHDTVSHSF